MGNAVVDYILNHVGWTFNLVMAHILFWLTGYGTFEKYGYSKYSQEGVNTVTGAVESGPYGSGEWPLTLIMCVLATVVYIKQLVEWNMVSEE